MNPKQTILLDASSLKSSGCILAFHNTLIGGYTSPISSSDMTFGSAFHLYRKVLTETGDDMLALGRACKYFKETPAYTKRNKAFLDQSYLVRTCEAHRDRYAYDEYKVVRSPETDKPVCELRWVYPFYTSADIEVLLCGTIDEVVHNGIADFYAIKDYKTTSAWNRAEYLDSYALSSQLMLYNYGLKKYAGLYPSSIIAKVCEKPLGAFIDGIFLGAGKDPAFERSQVFYYSEEQMAEFEKGLVETVEKIVRAVREPGKMLYREGMMNGSCQKVWGLCPYFVACSEPREDMRAVIMSENFARRKYDPMTFGSEG